jgi:hypothetical protein
MRSTLTATAGAFNQGFTHFFRSRQGTSLLFMA